MIQIVVGLLVPIVAGLAPVINGSRVTVLRAISGDLTMDEKQVDGSGEPATSPQGESTLGAIPNPRHECA